MAHSIKRQPRRAMGASNKPLFAPSHRREEISSIFADIKDYSATSFIGMKRKNHKEDKLTDLGAPPVKQQKMPFKQKIGIACAKKKHDVKNVQTARDQGVVLAAVSKKGRYDKGRRESSTNPKTIVGRASSAPRGRSESSSFGINTKGGVMHLSKKRLPEKLLRRKK